MSNVSIYGYKKGMSVEEVNTMSSAEIKKISSTTENTYQAHPRTTSLDNIGICKTKIDPQYGLFQIILISENFPYSELLKKFVYFKNKLIKQYGNITPEESVDDIILNYDDIKLVEKLKSTPDNLYYVWNKDIKDEYKSDVKEIKVIIQAFDDKYGKVEIIYEFNNTPQENKQNESEVTDAINFEEENGSPAITENSTDETNSTVVESAQTYDTPLTLNEISFENDETLSHDLSNKEFQKNGVPEFTETKKTIDKKLLKEYFLTVIGATSVFLIFLLFLYKPCFSNAKSLISDIYYVLFFLYTIGTCVTPFIIKTKYKKFENTISKEKEYLDSDNEPETENLATHSIWKTYKATFFSKSFGINNKTRAIADLYFDFNSVIDAQCKLPVANYFRLFSASFIGFGILGTFIGFSIGFDNINLTTTDVTLMTESIKALIQNGLTTAFNTSIVGVFCSLIYNFLIYIPVMHNINTELVEITDSLDKSYYVSETEALMEYTMLTDENQETVTFSNSLRFIIENMNNQTDALNNFNDNLADKIANMNETVNHAMGKMASDVGGELKSAVVENVHTELGGLKEALIETTKRLSDVAQKIADTPNILEMANSELTQYLEETRTGFSEMLDLNLKTNSKALDEIVTTIDEKLAKQFMNFNNSLNSALENSVKASEVLNSLPDRLKDLLETYTTSEKNVGEKFEQAAQKMTDISNSITNYLDKMESGISDLLHDLSIAENNVKELLVSAKLHEDTSGKNLTNVINETNTMLEGFKNVDVNLKDIFESIGKEIATYNSTVNSTLSQYLASFQDGSKAFSSTITSSTQDFGDTIETLSTTLSNIEKISGKFDNSVKTLNEIINNKESK
ncbi:MAG: hypothetical protein BKP49_02490 [Treponema sp. CETP13]|nr:MAG: hypothetical protein BKP49_02490 [Treponema sp. CETP13]